MEKATSDQPRPPTLATGTTESEEKSKYAKPLAKPHTIAIVDTELKCAEAIKQILSDCSGYPVVGLDSEWKHDFCMRAFGSKIGKVLIVSICSPLGYCALFRMNKLSKIPKCLKDFLENETVEKVCIGALTVVVHLLDDYKIQVEKHTDLRETAIMLKDTLTDHSRLDPVGKQIYGIYNERDLSNFDQNKWLQAELSAECIAFTAKNVFKFIELHKQFNEVSGGRLVKI